MSRRSAIRARLEFIEARLSVLKWKVVTEAATKNDIVWELEKLEMHVRTAHADFVEEEIG